MNNPTRSERSWQDGLNLALGLWLIVSPWVLGFAATRPAMWDGVIFGLVIAALAILALNDFRAWEEWTGMVIGALLIVSPWVLRFAATRAGAEPGHMAATWNFVLVGAVTLILAAWSLREHQAHRPA